MRGNTFACITDKLYKNAAEPRFLYIWIIFVFLSFGDIRQEKEKMDQWPQQWCWVVYSDCIIHQATGLGLAWVPRVHRCLMAWQVVSGLSGPDQNAAGCWTDTPDSLRTPSGLSIQSSSSHQLRPQLQTLLAGRKRFVELNDEPQNGYVTGRQGD